VLLKVEHAVARVLAQVPVPARAHGRVLEAIGATLGWEFGAAWEVTGDGAGLFEPAANSPSLTVCDGGGDDDTAVTVYPDDSDTGVDVGDGVVDA
jgi:hypothetical protein